MLLLLSRWLSFYSLIAFFIFVILVNFFLRFRYLPILIIELILVIVVFNRLGHFLLFLFLDAYLHLLLVIL